MDYLLDRMRENADKIMEDVEEYNVCHSFTVANEIIIQAVLMIGAFREYDQYQRERRNEHQS